MKKIKSIWPLSPQKINPKTMKKYSMKYNAVKYNAMKYTIIRAILKPCLSPFKNP